MAYSLKSAYTADSDGKIRMKNKKELEQDIRDIQRDTFFIQKMLAVMPMLAIVVVSLLLILIS